MAVGVSIAIGVRGGGASRSKRIGRMRARGDHVHQSRAEKDAAPRRAGRERRDAPGGELLRNDGRHLDLDECRKCAVKGAVMTAARGWGGL